MNLFDGKIELEDAYYVDENQYRIQCGFVDNTGNYSTYDAQVGDIIYLDGSLIGIPLLRYKIIELHLEEYSGASIVATVEWDMIEGIEMSEPFPGMEGCIGAIHDNGLTANITTSIINGVSEVLISKAQSYQSMLLGMNAGGGGSSPDLSQINKKIKDLEEKITSVQLEWEDLVALSFE